MQPTMSGEPHFSTPVNSGQLQRLLVNSRGPDPPELTAEFQSYVSLLPHTMYIVYLIVLTIDNVDSVVFK